SELHDGCVLLLLDLYTKKIRTNPQVSWDLPFSRRFAAFCCDGSGLEVGSSCTFVCAIVTAGAG
ncbi:hypothetical protein SB759_35050, partial [Pseudomonas sp. SIMBA_059]